MQNFYVALSTEQYAALLKNKTLPPTVIENGHPAFLFTEDKAYWTQKISEQDNLEDVNGYAYALVVEFQMDPGVIHGLVGNPATGRLSERIYEYYGRLGRKTDIPQLKPEDTNVFCVMDAYESDETADRVSQLCMLKVESTAHPLWEYFCGETPVIKCIGAVPGAPEAAHAMLSLMED